MRILFAGDVVGQPGRDALRSALKEISMGRSPVDFIIANGENSAGGNGLTAPIAEELFGLGVNAITLGNHTWARKEIEKLLEDERVVRPANYAPGVPGKGVQIFRVNGCKLAVINLMGRVYMPLADDPFRKADELLEGLRGVTQNIIVDFHAEITSEKLALGWYLDGRVSAVIGTHTHVQTADARVLPGGTAYLTDCGMCGPRDGVIGVDRGIILKKYLTGIPQRFEVANGDMIFNGCVLDIDEATGKARGIEPLFKVIAGGLEKT